MIELLVAQLEGLKDTQFYVPFAMIAIAFGAFVGGYKWMRATTKAEIAETVKDLQGQIDGLRTKVNRLENGRAKAIRLLLFGLEVFPQDEQNSKGRQYLHEAIDALTNVSQNES